MATIRSYTTIEQSKKLAEFLSLESADMYYPWDIDSKSFLNIPIVKDDSYYIQGSIPCWSLAALLDILRDKIIFGGNSPEGWFCCYTIKNPTKTLTIYEDSLVDACYSSIIKFNELNML